MERDKDQDNVYTLRKAGLIEKDQEVSDELARLINALSEQEIQQLIDMWKRVGKPDNEDIPNAFVFP